jgi:hypothetical protein
MAINKVRVSGDIFVPGPELLNNGDFSDGSTDWTFVNGSVIAEEAVVDSGVGIEGYVRSEISLTIGSTYQVQFDLNLISGKMQLEQWAGDTYKEYNTPAVYAGETVIITITNTGVEKILWGKHNDPGPFVFELDNVSVKELTPGPIDTYPANGTHNGQFKYTSNSVHADGVGSTEEWDIWWDNVSDWVISPAAGTEGPNYWSLTDSDIVGDYTENGLAAGTATVSEAGGGFRGRYSSGGRYAGQGRYQGSGRY